MTANTETPNPALQPTTPPGMRISLGTPSSNDGHGGALGSALHLGSSAPESVACRFSTLVACVAAADMAGLGQELARCLDAPMAGPAGRLLKHYVAALEKRYFSQACIAKNPYTVERAGPRDMLAAFETLLNETPLVRFGHDAVNAALRDAVDNAPHIIDLGIGTGAQMAALLGILDSVQVPHLKITGVDLPAETSDSAAKLKMVGKLLKKVAAERGIRLSFVPAPCYAETFRPQDWVTRGEPVCINAALTLHHLQEHDRNAILGRLHSIAPRILTLVEPDVDHHTLDLAATLRESFSHYLAVYEVLDHCLAETSRARRIIEDLFFGREIENIVVNDGSSRFERHERSAGWNVRMRAAGFRPPVDMPVLGSAGTTLLKPLSMVRHENGMSLRWKRTPVLTASVWAPRHG